MQTISPEDIVSYELGPEWDDHAKKNDPELKYPDDKEFADPTQIQALQPVITAITELKDQKISAYMLDNMKSKFKQKVWVQNAIRKIILKCIEKDKEHIKERNWNPYIFTCGQTWDDEDGNQTSRWDTFVAGCHEFL